jgi:hypothetical protein
MFQLNPLDSTLSTTFDHWQPIDSLVYGCSFALTLKSIRTAPSYIRRSRTTTVIPHRQCEMNACTSSLPFSRPDEYMCQHLRQLIAPASSIHQAITVKREHEDDASHGTVSSTTADELGSAEKHRRLGIERRFIEIVRWGAREEGAKRRRVGQQLPSMVFC